MFTFITEIRPPARPRHRVEAAEQSTQDLFPPDRTWRSAFTIHVLKTHLQDFTRLGVADESFRLHGIGLLVSIITDEARHIDTVVFERAIDCLVEFLRGSSATLATDDMTDPSTERPPICTTATLIKSPTSFVSRMVDVCFSFLRYPSERSADRNRMLELVFKALIEAFRHQPSMWQCFTDHARIHDLHQNLFLHSDMTLVAQVTGMVKSFCVEPDSANYVIDFYMRLSLAILPHALESRTPTGMFFSLAVDTLTANKLLQKDEVRSREICHSLLSTLQTYKHCETVDMPQIDMKVSGLLNLLMEAIVVIRSFKKPLKMPGLAVKIFTRLLFPPLKDLNSRPLVDQVSRSLAYGLVDSTCENRADFLDLLAATPLPMQSNLENPGNRFPGVQHYKRPAWQCSGLTNLGMTCYMNSLLQQLFANIQFRKFIFETPSKHRPRQEVLFQVQELFARMQDEYTPVCDTSALANTLNIHTGTQEDVHGFYEDFLGKLEENMPNAKSKIALRRFFSGTLITQIKGECGHVSPKTEPFVDLQVIVKNKANLLDSLQESVQGEPMEGTNKYRCLLCDAPGGDGRLVNAMRRACPEYMPDNLTFCLKRFAFDLYGQESKVNDRFEFPQMIDMSRWSRAYLDDPKASIDEDVFELVGVIVHQGTLALGHYWSYTLLRNTGAPDSRTWVKLEDRRVSHCEKGIEDVQYECFGGFGSDGSDRTDNAYVLFYQRKHCLDEPIPLSAAVHNPVTPWPLPPKVTIPLELQESIHECNEWRNHQSNLFEDDFHTYVLRLLSRYGHFLPASPPPSECDSPEAESGLRPIPDSKQEQSMDEFAKQTSEVAVTYLQRVATRDPTPVSRTERCLVILRSLISSQPRFAFHVLRRLALDEAWLYGVAKQIAYKSHMKIFEFVKFCLSQVREQQDDSFYRQAFSQILRAHSAVKNDVDPVHLDWERYLRLPVILAQMGPWETASVLDCDYLSWALGILYTPITPMERQKLPGLADHVRNNAREVTALFGFISAMLDNDVILPELNDQRTDWADFHRITIDGIVLKPNEVKLLVQSRLWMECAPFAVQKWYVSRR